MATLTPAFISYTPSGKAEQTLKFHAIFAETHQASSQITKFPVQTGFMISNNAIRKNRVVTIKGMISNYLLEGANNAFSYSDDNCSSIFEALHLLVNSAQVCTVMTNLGIYENVVFTKFNTTQSQGKVDSMEFTITGEEIQVSDSVSGTAPKILSFTRLDGAAKANREGFLRSVGIDVCPCNNISEAQFRLGQDFIVEDVNSAGLAVTTTYLATSQDPSAGVWNYEVHTSDTLVHTPPYTYTFEELTSSEIAGITSSGISKVTECLEDTVTEVATQAVEDTIDTAMGELRKSVYGAVYDAVDMTDNEYGQVLIQSGIGCLVRGITNADPQFPYTPGESLPTTAQIMEGAKAWGEKLFSKDTGKSTNGFTGATSLITKVDCC